MTRLRGRSEHVCKVSVVTIGGGSLQCDEDDDMRQSPEHSL